MDMLEDHSPTPEDSLIEFDRIKNIQKLIKKGLKQCMNKREAEIISRRSLTYTPETLEEISHHMNVSKERIRQIEIVANKKLTLWIHNTSEAKELIEE